MKVISLLMFATTLFLVTACGDKDDDKGSKLGGDAAANQKVFGNIVAGMESPAVMFRLSVDQIIRKSGLLKNDETSMMLERGMEMLKAADLKQPVRVAVDFRSKEDMWIVATIGVENGADFKKLIQSVAKIGEEKDGISTAVISEKDVKMMLRFNDNLCIAVAGNSMRGDSDFESYMDKVMTNAGKDGELHESFKTFLEGTEDIAFAYSFDPVMKLIPESELDESSQKMIPYLQGSFANASINFENGAFVMRADTDLEDPGVFEELMGDGLSAEYGSFLAFEKFYGYLGLDMGLETMMNFVKMSHSKESQEFGEMSPEQLVEIFTGEAAMAIMKVDGLAEEIMHEDEPEIEVDENFDALNDLEPQESVAIEVEVKNDSADLDDFLLIAGLKDPAALEAFLTSSKKMSKKGNLYVTETGTLLLIRDNKLFATSSVDVINAVESGNMERSAKAEAMLANPVSLYVDFKAIYADLQSMIGDDEFEGSNYLKLLDNASGFSDGSHAEFRLEFIDKNVNALEQLIMIILQDNPEMMFGSMLM